MKTLSKLHCAFCMWFYLHVRAKHNNDTTNKSRKGRDNGRNNGAAQDAFLMSIGLTHWHTECTLPLRFADEVWWNQSLWLGINCRWSLLQ